MNWDYSNHYASFHPDTPEHWQQMSERMQRWLGPHLPADRTIPVLDVGCGRGYALRALRDLGFTHVCGIDADAGQAGFAQEHGMPVEHVQDTPTWLAARPGAFGVVLLLDVLEHIPKAAQPAFLQAIAGSLRKQGLLIITVPNAAASLSGYWREIDYTHEMSFTSSSLQYLLTHTGFGAVQCHEIELAPPSWSPRAIVQRFLRTWRRVEFMAEFGRAGAEIPVTPNFLAVTTKSHDARQQL
jgi:2-polyprenyl-3-methyl-5-hydroxy-6-metoxy-1,4-benzoquinol methylase